MFSAALRPDRTARRESLNSAELQGVVDLLLSSATPEQEELVLAKPREALREARGVVLPAWDPRLGSAGNRISKQLSHLLNQLGWMENWLCHGGRAELSACDRGPLAPGFTRLARDTRSVAELVEDVLVQLSMTALEPPLASRRLQPARSRIALVPQKRGHRALDVRRYKLARVSERYGQEVFKRIQADCEKQKKEKDKDDEDDSDTDELE